MAEKSKEKKVKRPTAQKRELQNKKRRLRNKAFKSEIRTTIRKFEDALAKGDSATREASIQAVYSVMDKGVKGGVVKLNKASRTKSRLTARLAAKA